MHYYKRHIGDYAKKAGHLSPLEHGVYNLIIDSYYDREQAPTLLEATRWARARTEEEKAAVLAVLDEFFTLDGERYRQNRVEEELELYHAKAEVNRTIAVERERRKRERRVDDQSTLDERLDQERTPDEHESCTSGQPNHKPLTTNQKKSSSAAKDRGARIPEDWHPTIEETAFCKTERPDLRPSDVAQRFFDYWRAVPGQRGRKLDWSATWRNWVRDEKPGKSADQPKVKDWE